MILINVNNTNNKGAAYKEAADFLKRTNLRPT